MQTYRLTLELREVLVAGIKYLSNMDQSIIDKYESYYSEYERKWLTVGDISDLERATKGCLDDAEHYTFIKVPGKDSDTNLVERILNHFPGVKIESVEDLGFQAMVENSRKSSTTAENVESFNKADQYIGGSEMVKSLAQLADEEGDKQAIEVCEKYQAVLESILETGSEDERKAASMLMQR